MMNLSRRINVYLAGGYFVTILFLVAILAIILISNFESNLARFKLEFVELSNEYMEKEAGIFFNAYKALAARDHRSVTDLELIIALTKNNGYTILFTPNGKRINNPTLPPEIELLLASNAIEEVWNSAQLYGQDQIQIDNFKYFLEAPDLSVAPAKVVGNYDSENDLIVAYATVLHSSMIRLAFVNQENRRNTLIFTISAVSIAILGAFVFGSISAGAISQKVTAPLRALERACGEIEQGKFGFSRLAIGTDEIGVLGKAFLSMSDQLEASIHDLKDAAASLEEKVELRTKEITTANLELEREIQKKEVAEKERDAIEAELMQTAHQAGMAEIATSVLHNIGNALTSINVSASVVRDTMENSANSRLQLTMNQIRDLEKSGEIAAFINSPENQKKLIDLLHQLTGQILLEHTNVRSEFDNISKGVDHLKEIIHWQQDYARGSAFYETVSLKNLLEDAIVLSSTNSRRPNIEIEYNNLSAQKLEVNKHKVIQILQNLISNAHHATEGMEASRKISIGCKRLPGQKLSVEVKDNGIGITPEQMNQLFRFGYSTRQHKGGHGFGLHSCKLMAKELGGELLAQSEGEKEGACFTFIIPTQAIDSAQSPVKT